jgi:hypothetical protein
MIPFISNLRALFIRNERLSFASAGTLMLLMVVGMGMVSLTSLNDKAMKGYQLNKLETSHEQLVQDGEVTDMLSLRARSMSVIEAATTYMVKPDRTDITYVLPVAVVASNDSELSY